MSQNAPDFDRISRNVSILLRTERMIARRQMAVLRSQSGLLLLAGLIATLGLVMLNIAAFFALNAVMPAWGTAFLIALADVALAALVAGLALRLDAKADLAPAVELRDQAIADLEAEARDTLAEAGKVTADLRRIARDPLGSLLPGVLAPLLSLLLNSKKKP